MSKQQNFTKGRNGEDIAREYLRKNGYSLLEKNFNNRFGEIDLIVTKNKTIIFIEVKLKVGEDYGTPEEMIGKRKLFQVQQTSVAFLQKYPELLEKFPFCQIDAVCVVVDKKEEILRINHYENLTF